MRTHSTPFALFLALLVVLWQPLCLCNAEGGEDGHSHNEPTHASEDAGHHHASDSPSPHEGAGGDHHDDGKGDPCDGHGGSCDCSKSFASPQKTAETGSGNHHELNSFAGVWSPGLLIETLPYLRHGIRAVAWEELPPPPLLKLYRVLLI